MTLACGCAIKGGVLLTVEELRIHYTHTFEAMIFWELMRRENTPQDDRNLKLSQARLDYIEAIDALYPEVQGET